MNTKLLTLARANYSSPYVDRATNRRNQLAWARSVHALGDHWMLATSPTLKEIKKCRCRKK